MNKSSGLEGVSKILSYPHGESRAPKGCNCDAGAMNVWYRKVPVAIGEATRINVPVNDCRGWRAVGGRMAITDRAIAFEPNWIDYVAGARGWRIPLEDVVSTTIVMPPHRSVNPYKLRRRLRIDARHRAPLIITVANLDSVADLVRHPRG